MVLYGQMIIGAPGAGKTTYCDGMQQYLKLLGRDCCVVNLDPANELPPADVGSGVATAAAAVTGNEDSGAVDRVKMSEDGRQEEKNAQLTYETILDVCQDVISLDSVMSELKLGPNGGLLYCMEYIEHHLGEVIKLLKERLGMLPYAGGGGVQCQCRSSPDYLLFDLPGQIELTAHSNVISRIAYRLVRELDLRLVCVQLVDASICLTDVSKFIGAALMCTASMMRMELPCVNVLSKMDLLQNCSSIYGGRIGEKEKSDYNNDYGYADCGASPLPFNLEFFTQCNDLHRLVEFLDSNPMDFFADSSSLENIGAGVAHALYDHMEDREYQEARQRTRSSNFHCKYRRLHNELCGVVEDFSLLSFLPLSIQDSQSVGRLVARVDRCNGYVFLKGHCGAGTGSDGSMHDMLSSALVVDGEWDTSTSSDVQEKYLGEVMFREDIVELRGKQTGRISREGVGKSVP